MKADLQLGDWGGEYAILDTETGELLALTEKPARLSNGSVSIIDWNESGIYIRVDARRDDRVVETAMFRAAAPGAAFERLQPPAPEYEVRSASGNFKLQFLEDRTTVLLHGQGNELLQTFGEESHPGGFSADEQYLWVLAGGSEVLLRWDGDRFVDTGLAQSGLWSPVGHSLAYQHPENPDNSLIIETHELDAGTGHSRFVAGGSPAGWSPDGRYLAVHDASAYAITVYDAELTRPVLHATAARFAGWLADDTLLVVADYCGTSRFAALSSNGDLSYIDADSPGRVGFLYSAHNLRIAYRTLVRENPTAPASIWFEVLDLRTGSRTPFETGPYDAPQQWSPDDRYLVLYIPGGRGGPCQTAEERDLQTTIEIFP